MHDEYSFQREIQDVLDECEESISNALEEYETEIYSALEEVRICFED